MYDIVKEQIFEEYFVINQINLLASVVIAH